jgi:pimeloyl-ACP methyl ester carboxylesterase
MVISRENFFTTSDKAHIYFEEHGKGQPLVFIPGFMCSTVFFRRNIEGLSRHYRIILMDQRGHGRSSKTLANNTICRCAQDVKELIDHLHLEDVVLFGWSLGGAVAAQYAQQFNEYRLAGLGLIEATLFAFSPEEWNTHRCAKYNIDGWLDAVKVWIYNPLQYHDNFCARISNTPLSEEDISWIKPEIARCYSHTGVEFQLDVYHSDNVTPLANRTIPVAIFAAETEAYGGLKAGREYKSRVTGAPSYLYEFYQGGHMLFYFESEKFNQCVMEFVNGLK